MHIDLLIRLLFIGNFKVKFSRMNFNFKFSRFDIIISSFEEIVLYGKYVIYGLVLANWYERLVVSQVDRALSVFVC